MLNLHRAVEADFRDTEGHTVPMVHAPRGDAHPEAYSGIPDQWDDPATVDSRAEEQYRPEGLSRFVWIVIEALFWAAALALIAGMFKAPQIWERL